MSCAHLFGALLLLAQTSVADEKPSATPARKLDFEIHERERSYGTVLAVTKTSILICDERKGPVSFPFHDRLAAGGVHKKVCAASSYRASDIKVGDLVISGLMTENKQVFCVDLSIRERPGGLVPPGQVIDKKYTYHERLNAELAFRDKGTPIPEHLKDYPPSMPRLDKPKK